jgi:hypothetical protein
MPTDLSLDKALEATGLGSWLFDHQRQRFFPSAALSRLLALSDDAAGLPWVQFLRLWAPADQPLLQQALAYSTAGFQLDLQLQVAGSPVRQLHMRGQIMHQSLPGQPAWSAGVMLEIHAATQLPQIAALQAVLAFRHQTLQHILADMALPALLEGMLAQLEVQMPQVRASVLLFDEPSQSLGRALAPSLPESYCRALERLKIGPQVGSCGTAAYRREPVFVGDIAHDPLWADYRAIALSHGLAACWSWPILSAGKVLGTLALYWGSPCKELPSMLWHWLEAAAELAGVAIESAKRQTELQELHHSMHRAEATAQMGRWEFDVKTGRSWWSAQMWALLEREPGSCEPGLLTLLEQLDPLVVLQHSFDCMMRGQAHQPLTLRLPSSTSPSGVKYILLPSCNPRYDATGELRAYEGTIIDITTSKLGEERLHQQLSELRRWQQITLGREGRVLELKAEINELLTRLGEAPRYASAASPLEPL